MRGIIRRLHKPTRHVIERLPTLGAIIENLLQIILLLGILPFTPLIWRISADVRLSTFILEVDLGLIERRPKQVIRLHLHAVPVGGQMVSQSSRRALPQVIQFRCQGQELGQG